MRKIALAVIVCFAFALPMFAWGFNSQFNSQPIQSDPSFGDGSRYVGNTKVQIIIPASSTDNVAPAPKLPDQLPSGETIPNPAKFEVQPSQVTK